MGAPRQNSPVASVFHFYRGQSKRGCATEVGWCIQVFKWLFKCSCLTVVAVYHIRSLPEIECDSVSYFQQKRRRNTEYEFCKYGKNNDIGVDPGFGVFCSHGILCSWSAR